MQEFLGAHRWDHGRLRDRLQQLVAHDHASEHSVGTLDDCGCPKKGDKTPGVQRQYCGATGKVDNCVVTVHLGYAAGDFHCLLDSELYLPESWAADRRRCREAGIPDELTYRPKWAIALGLYDRAVANGVRFAWLTFDEGYGGKPGLLRALRQRRQRYVAAVPCTFSGWLGLPALTAAGRWAGEPARAVQELLACDPRLVERPWAAYRVKEGHKGPLVWEVKHAFLFPRREDGDPGRPVHLVVARYALDRAEVKYFVSNAPPGAPVETLLLVAFSRWRIERLFEDSKSELGLDHFEVRRYGSITRHLLLTCVSHLFLAEFVQARRGKKSRADRVPGANGHARPRARVAPRRTLLAPPGRNHRGAIGDNPATKCRRSPQPSQANAATIEGHRNHDPRATHLSVANEVAL